MREVGRLAVAPIGPEQAELQVDQPGVVAQAERVQIEAQEAGPLALALVALLAARGEPTSSGLPGLATASKEAALMLRRKSSSVVPGGADRTAAPSPSPIMALKIVSTSAMRPCPWMPLSCWMVESCCNTA